MKRKTERDNRKFEMVVGGSDSDSDSNSQGKTGTVNPTGGEQSRKIIGTNFTMVWHDEVRSSVGLRQDGREENGGGGNRGGTNFKRRS